MSSLFGAGFEILVEEVVGVHEQFLAGPFAETHLLPHVYPVLEDKLLEALGTQHSQHPFITLVFALQ